MSKLRLATVWLDGCSGCHMSLLDIDERLLSIAEQADLVYSPLVDEKVFPENVDIALVEGAVSSEEDLNKILLVRSRAKVLVSLGDCSVTGQCSWDAQSVRRQSDSRPCVSRERDARLGCSE